MAVGASVAYPLLRMARAIPVPILMIGAGLFFAGSKKGRDLTQQASDMANDLADSTRQRTQHLADRVSRSAAGARDYAADTFDKVTVAVGEGSDKLRRSGAEVTGITRAGVTSNLQNVRDAADAAVGSVSAGISDLQQRASGFASDTSASVQAKLSEVTSTLSQTATDSKQAGQEMLSKARDRVADVTQRTSQTMKDTVVQNPLLVAGVGLLLGGLIASALPKFQAEDALLGDASTAMKKRAQDAAARGFETAKGAADEIISNAAQKAQAEGLTPDGLARGAQDFSQRVQRVAERAVNTAFKPEVENQEPGTGEHHG